MIDELKKMIASSATADKICEFIAAHSLEFIDKLNIIDKNFIYELLLLLPNFDKEWGIYKVGNICLVFKMKRTKNAAVDTTLEIRSSL